VIYSNAAPGGREKCLNTFRFQWFFAKNSLHLPSLIAIIARHLNILVRIFDAHVRQNALCCGEDRSHQDHREVKK